MALSWQINAEVAGVAALCMGDAAAFLSGTCPSLFTMRTFRSSRDVVEANNTRTDIRIGAVIASGLAIIVGGGGSLVTESWWPLAATLVSLAALIAAYEWALANPHNKRSSIKDQ